MMLYMSDNFGFTLNPEALFAILLLKSDFSLLDQVLCVPNPFFHLYQFSIYLGSNLS